MFDLPFNGCFFTLTNKRVEKDLVARKLDRAMAKEVLMEVFCKTNVEFQGGVSDHSPVVISVGRRIESWYWCDVES
jgi:hypothetical protein